MCRELKENYLICVTLNEFHFSLNSVHIPHFSIVFLKVQIYKGCLL